MRKTRERPRKQAVKDSACFKKLIFPAFAAVLLVPSFAAKAPAKETGRKVSVSPVKSGDAYYYFTAAQMLKKSGNVAGAIDLYRRAIALDPDSAELYSDLGSLYMSSVDLPAGEKDIETGIKKE